MSPDQLKSAAAQTHLKALGFYAARIDGDWGPISKSAARAWLAQKQLAILGRMPQGRRHLLKASPANETLRTLAAQIFLADLGMYPGLIDAQWGPISQFAAARWDDSVALDSLPDTVLTPYDVARQNLGVREIPGKSHNSKIVQWLRAFQSWISEDETAWCSAFVGHCAREAGYETEGSTLAARSWGEVGQPISLDAARKGDVVIFWRVSPTSWQGHVGFFESYDRSRKTLRILGGNQNDEVNITTYTATSVLGVRRLRSLDALQGPSNQI